MGYEECLDLVEQLAARRVPLRRIEQMIDGQGELDEEQRAALYLYAHGRVELGARVVEVSS